MEKTNLNVSPYYDDFDEQDNYHRILFRPGFSVQARELTQLQTILQNQIERHGRHIFKEGTVVIPGSIGFTNEYFSVKLNNNFEDSGTNTILDVNEYINEYIGKRIVGRDTGVVAEVIDVEIQTTENPPILYVKYIKNGGTDNATTRFADGENIYTDSIINLFGVNSDSATLAATNATATGSSANIEEGVYFIRGHFVRVNQQRIILDRFTNTPSYRIGLAITETLETPEEVSKLLDNAQGSNNLNAAGAHRLKISANLSKLPIDSESDGNFIELLRLKNGIIQQKVRNTEYSVITETLARRTFDQSGDFIVKPFDIQIKETLNDGFNDGVYTLDSNNSVITESGNVPSEDYLTYQISPGKAYVNGYEVETISPKYIDVEKSRDYLTYNNGVTPIEIGNYVFVNNVFNSPEITPKNTNNLSEPYRQIDLYNTQNATPGAPNGNRIGFCRSRGFEHYSSTNSSSSYLSDSTDPTTDSTFKLYLFDIRMFTEITLDSDLNTSFTISNYQGAKITGVRSKAYGYLSSEYVSGVNNKLFLTNVVGNFEEDEQLISSSIDSSSNEGKIPSATSFVQISSVKVWDFSSVKQTFMDGTLPGTPPQYDFTADIVLNSNLTLSGFVSWDTSYPSYPEGPSINGYQTSFLTELQVGDIIAIPSGTNNTIQNKIVTSIRSNTEITVDSSPTSPITTVEATRKRARLEDQNKNILLRKLQKSSIKSLLNDGVSDTSVVYRKTFFGTISGTNSITFNCDPSASENFLSVNNVDYILTNLNDGKNINLEHSNISTTISSNQLTINGLPIANVDVRLIATVISTSSLQKDKTLQRAKMVIVDNDDPAEYGTSAHHKDISLGFADGFKLYAVYDSEDSGSDPLLPECDFTLTSAIPFVVGEIITGSQSGAKSLLITNNNPIKFVPLNNLQFISGEELVGEETGATGIIGSNFVDGSTNITNNFVFDTGQRDNFYDIARIIRKPGSPSPTGKLLIVFDYFSHDTSSTKNFFTVDSYQQIDYKDIYTYTATRIDPEVREQTGEYDLRDAVDFRPRVGDATSIDYTSSQSLACKKVTSYSLNFENRNFSGITASIINIPKDNSSFIYDFEYYLGRIDTLIITKEGEFRVIKGTPSENPISPKLSESGLKLAETKLSPYLIDINDVELIKEIKKNYTAEDIGKLDERISNIEYYTALNLLEKDAQSFEILDDNGLNRFKCGFLVDGFSGHSIGDVSHPDYRVSIDMENKELRPKYYMKGVPLKEKNTTEDERTKSSYQLTGDLITLPYSHVVSASQPYATRTENLNPVLNFSWAGVCKLSPSGDEWFEVNKIPDLLINREGNFNTILAQNKNAIGTVWNAWQTQWSGQTTSRTFRLRSGRSIISRTVDTNIGTSSRTGIQTNIIPQIDTKRLSNRVLSETLIPFIRSKNITFTAEGMKPLTRVYPFFDRTNISSYVTPDSGNLGDPLITSSVGSITGIFSIPDPTVNNNPKFRTGERQFRLTSDRNNNETNVETFAQAIYSATGILNNIQDTIISTRNARIEVQNVSESQNVTRSTNRDVVVGVWRGDPLAQSFSCDTKGGEYITKVDVYFQSKDTDIPVLCQIREMYNGYPTSKVIPFGSKTLNSSEVSISDDASVATTFNFDSPVYLKENTEYCIFLFSNSNKYLAWISRMGELDVATSRAVSKQPFLGVLFKSQNSSIWSAYDFEDLKFTLYRASFNTSVTGNVKFVNDTLPLKNIEENNIQTFSGVNLIKVNHPNHHMYSSNNSVILSGVESGISTRLSGSVNAGSTSLTLVSGTFFTFSDPLKLIYLKINNDILTGTILGNDVTLTSGAPNSYSDGDVVVLEMLNGIPLSEINKTHNSIGNIEIDSYTLSTTTAAEYSGIGGGINITATENAMANYIHTLFPIVEHPKTTLELKLQTTTGTSVNGNETSFSKQNYSLADSITINENFYLDSPKIICSEINEISELPSQKSLELTFLMKSDVENLSPVIDIDRKTLIAVSNRLNNISPSSTNSAESDDVYPPTDYVVPTEPDGDSLEAIYCTKKVQLKTPATAIKVLLNAVQMNESNIELMYKILRSDDSSDFEEIGWNYFNNNGSPDQTVNFSATIDDFIEREYTAERLEEFISFAIKIRLLGSNSSEPPRIKDLRAIALAI